MLRHSLYEAANSLLARVKRDCVLRTWGLELAKAKGPKRARVAVARKLAVLLHTLWRTETSFRWA
jgi:transposase